MENISTGVTAELAYILEIERHQVRVGEAAELSPMAVRVTLSSGASTDTLTQ